jgi:hypothetical protein
VSRTSRNLRDLWLPLAASFRGWLREHCPLFKLLRKSGPFTWTKEAEQAFQELKQHLTSLPILVAPEPGEPLYLYIAVAAEAVSMVLVAERATPEGQGPENL